MRYWDSRTRRDSDAWVPASDKQSDKTSGGDNMDVFAARPGMAYARALKAPYGLKFIVTTQDSW
ncbi:protein of unknown function (plasmid) [Methylotuvimicrobium alcaliphilum 20Z]|uniref:Uncharacterized protein n=1 Tax=Methylotuvimicrobium alcaliphilum (strain DSM 19304 / NCIMB 14124 / VKM B-2133 / 20Z) TaxID=1091494 RepID=G4T4J6_META2|nr:protein of unknown function [Methylotuvimicrobium alcaliphilum 20Z]